MTDLKHPRLMTDAVWMAWTYGDLNNSKASVKERVQTLTSPFSQWSFIDQTHSDIVKEACAGGSLGEADAQYTSQIGLGLTVQTADCVPIFLLGRLNTGEPQVGVVHAGWRGLANQIVSRTIEKMSNVHSAVIGPCIGVNRYEVGEEVIEAIVATSVPRDVCVVERSPRPHLDVKRSAAYQLRQLGVRNIETMGFCTYDDEKWASYRREGSSAGRIISIVGLL